VLALSAASACNVYSPDLMDRGALSSAGETAQGGDAIGVAGGNAGASETGGNSGLGGASGSGAGSAQGGSAPAAGSGGSSAGAGGAAGSATAGAGVGGSAGATNLDLIDNLEDNDGSIHLVNNPKRDGIWDSGNDGAASSPSGVQTPLPGHFKPLALLAADAPYVGDKYAAYSKATGFTQYAFMNVSMRSWPSYDTTYPKYDASANKGIQFLAKAGKGSSLGVRVRFISGDTDPRGGKCKLPTDMPAPTPSELCYNHYYAPVTLSNDWATYTLDFTTDFFQGTDGMVNATIDLKELYGFEFYFGPSDDYEIWVDDLYFVKN
jgi:hypothetical protein